MLKRSAAMALLGLKEKFKLTQASLQDVIQSMTAMTQQNISTLKSFNNYCAILFMCLLKIYGVLSSANIPHTQAQGLEECFMHYEYPFVGLEMNYRQIQYYKNNFDLIVWSYVCVPAYNN